MTRDALHARLTDEVLKAATAAGDYECDCGGLCDCPPDYESMRAVLLAALTPAAPAKLKGKWDGLAGPVRPGFEEAPAPAGETRERTRWNCPICHSRDTVSRVANRGLQCMHCSTAFSQPPSLACGALWGGAAATVACELPKGHTENHRGVGDHLTVQWPDSESKQADALASLQTRAHELSDAIHAVFHDFSGRPCRADGGWCDARDHADTVMQLLRKADAAPQTPVYWAEALDCAADGLVKLKPEELEARAPKIVAVMRHAANALREGGDEMSVGGQVVEVVRVNDREVWVNTDDNAKRTRGSAANLCAVFVDPDGHDISVGDSLWWQGGTCYWTPKDRPFGVSDIPLRKIGYSGVKRPG